MQTTQEWFYPNKNQFPTEEMDYIVIKNIHGSLFKDVHHFYQSEKQYWIEGILAWTYFPEFNFNL